jgi:hypothetical protein
MAGDRLRTSARRGGVSAWLVATATLAALAGTGCTSGVPRCKAPPPPAAVARAEYALMEYRAGGELGRPPKIEIQDTPTYRDKRAGFGVAAIRLPDSCEQESAASVGGLSAKDRTKTILATQCGVWLAELERALTSAKFRVISWDALRGMERQKSLSPYEAGKVLGADIVFVFNSLDASPVKAGASAGASFKYFVSDARGAKGPPLALDDQTRAMFKDFAKRAAGGDGGDAQQVVALSSSLDSTAIPTGLNDAKIGGESIWFYRRTVTLPIKTTKGMRFLFGRMPFGAWQPAAPWVPPQMAVPQGPRLQTEDVTESQVSGSVDDAYAAERLELIRAAATDFVDKFRSGRK